MSLAMTAADVKSGGRIQAQAAKLQPVYKFHVIARTVDEAELMALTFQRTLLISLIANTPPKQSL